MRRLRPHLTYANVMASIALFAALGGTGYAALKLPKNSVKARQIAKNAVGTSELKRGAVRSGDVKNRSLKAVDFKAGQLPAGDRGPVGPAGPKGDPGPTVSASASSTEDLLISPQNGVSDTDPLETAITTTFRSRLVATVAARYFDANADAAADLVRCKLSLDPPPPDPATGTVFSRETAISIDENDNTGTASVTGRTASLAPGTYHVAMHCLGSDTGLTFDEGDLTVIAVAD